MKLVFAVLPFVLLLSAWAAAADSQICSQRLFYIEKSTNSNIVAYDANIDGKGMLNDEEPMYIYWSRINSTKKRALGWLEETFAYGVNYLNETAGLNYLFRITALPDKTVELTMADGCPRVIVNINGEPAILNKVYVNLTGTGLSSNIKYIELSGVSADTGALLTERITNK